MYTLTAQDRHGVWWLGVIRRLTPLECFRLQGFTDAQFFKVAALGLKDGQLYKLAGNAVSVPVISALGLVIKSIEAQYQLERMCNS
jgi:DNA (cytosine-5)-methyltransferase 1